MTALKVGIYFNNMFFLGFAMPSPVFQFQTVDHLISEIDSLFDLFLKYWDTCRKRGREYTSIQVEFICAELYQVFSNYWKRKIWLIEEINEICDVLSVCCACMNPNIFLNEKTAFIFHIKNCFILGEI